MMGFGCRACDECGAEPYLVDDNLCTRCWNCEHERRAGAHAENICAVDARRRGRGWRQNVRRDDNVGDRRIRVGGAKMDQGKNSGEGKQRV